MFLMDDFKSDELLVFSHSKMSTGRTINNLYVLTIKKPYIFVKTVHFSKNYTINRKLMIPKVPSG